MRKLIFFLFPILGLFAQGQLFNIGPQFAYTTYHDSGDLTSKDGYLWGGQVGFTVREGMFVDAFMGKMGGSLHGPVYRTQAFWVQGVVGFEIPTEFMSLIPFWGFRYDMLKQHRKFQGMYLTENIVTMPLGLWVDLDISSMVSLGLRGSMLIPVSTKLRISNAKGADWHREQKYSYLFDLPITIHTNHKWVWNLVVDPYVRYYKLGRTVAATNSGLGLNVPSAQYHMYGVNVSIQFAF